MILYRKNKNWDFITVELNGRPYTKQILMLKLNIYIKINGLEAYDIDIIETVFMGDKVTIYFAIV